MRLRITTRNRCRSANRIMVLSMGFSRRSRVSRVSESQLSRLHARAKLMVVAVVMSAPAGAALFVQHPVELDGSRHGDPAALQAVGINHHLAAILIEDAHRMAQEVV